MCFYTYKLLFNSDVSIMEKAVISDRGRLMSSSNAVLFRFSANALEN